MHETSKSILRRIFDQRFATRYLVGDGIDIGSGADSVGNYGPLFPQIRSVRPWDVPDGDAMLMAGVADASLDFVHSSHCLEHLQDPYTALFHWIRICRPGGYVIVVVPDEDLYEQGVFPRPSTPTTNGRSPSASARAGVRARSTSSTCSAGSTTRPMRSRSSGSTTPTCTGSSASTRASFRRPRPPSSSCCGSARLRISSGRGPIRSART